MTWAFLLILFLDSAHLPAPMALAWSHPGFRQAVASQHQAKFILAPLLVFSLAILTVPMTLMFWSGFNPVIHGTKIGTAINRDLLNPFTALLVLFVVWNLYHFGAQNFGLWRLWRRGRGSRWLQKWACVGGTTFGMVGVPALIHALTPVCVWAFGLAHWVGAIELAARVSRYRLVFWSAMLTAGVALSAVIVAAVVYGSLVVQMIAVSARVGLGLIHFLYDRWVWKLSDERVRATIGKEVFA